jgi:GNAT superfamily N-acetyltransferase
VNIEPIKESDIPELLVLYKFAALESRYKDWPFDEEMAAKALLDCCNTPGWGVKCVSNGEIIGVNLAYLTTLVFSPRLMGMHMAFYVYPKHRRTRAFYLLIKAFIAWCDENKVPEFVTLHFQEDNTYVARMLKKLGLKEHGVIYSRGI